MSSRLPREFFDNPTPQVAQQLLGKILVVGDTRLRITETEAYAGDDPASHGARGKTKRNAPMFGPPGTLYVYKIYGIHHCFNIVTEREDFPAAVLIRRGVLLGQNKKIEGPGILCRELNFDTSYNELDLCAGKNMFVEDAPAVTEWEERPRIGISRGCEKRWRFVMEEK